MRDLALAGLRALPAAAGGVSYETIVVDNGSADGTADAIRAAFPDVQLIESRENRGFGAANNLALRRTTGRYVFFMNPDAQPRPGAIERLVGDLEARPDVGVVGPRLRYPDGTVQSSRRRFPTITTLLVESCVPGRWWPSSSILRRFYVEDRANDRPQSVDWLVGAALLVRRDALDPIGGFDERFFLYSEELDLCRRLRERGWRIAYDPAAEVLHYEGKSSEQNLTRRAMAFTESRARYVEKYAGPDVGRALRLYLLANTAYDLVGEASKLALRHKPALRRARVRALSTVLWFQLREVLGAGKVSD